MRIQIYDIAAKLQPYIKLICTMDCDADVDTNYIQVLPDACVELFINYTSTPVAIIDNQLYKRSIITARMSCSMGVQMRKGAGCLAICFHPGMAYHFFQVPMHILSNNTVAFSDIKNDIAIEMEDKLAAAHSNDERVSIVQKYLLQQLAVNKQDLQVSNCLRQMHRSGGLIPVSELTHNTGLSQRHLSRKFQQCVGLSPKEYLRVCRFLRSLHYLKKHHTLSLTEIAYESGYYDQSHFNRDYKAYSNHTPGELIHANYILY